MTQSKRVAVQRRVVLDELKVNSDPVVFELLADILSIEREHKDHKHGVREAIKTAVERTAAHDLPAESD